MIVGPTKTLFMDEISTNLDNSMTFQIVKCLRQIVHITEATILIVYQGPRENILEFFETCGFRCLERKGIADFLQEVTSRKDQEQYWADRTPYRYVSVKEFANRFKRFHVGMRIANELSVPFDKAQSHKAAFVFKTYSIPKMQLLKACFDKEWLLMQTNSFIYIFKTVQIIIGAFIALRLN
ncbi:hypothetical protein ACFX16_046729 [Malus domestica]